jgi:hypothetical protein
VAFALIGVAAPFVGGGLVIVGALAFSLVMRAGMESSSEVLVESGAHRLPLGNNG